jgi:hypothetical protein
VAFTFKHKDNVTLLYQLGWGELNIINRQYEVRGPSIANEHSANPNERMGVQKMYNIADDVEVRKFYVNKKQPKFDKTISFQICIEENANL